MHELRMNEVVRQVFDPKAVLEEIRNKGWSAWLVLDPGCHPDALARLYALEPDTKKTLLFLDSRLEHMHELSPRILPVTPGSLILDWLEEHDPRGWGMVVASDAPIEDVLAHLRSLLLVKTEGKNLIFRIWDGRILERICAAMPEEAPLLLGPARLVLTRTSAEGWARIDHAPENPDAPRPVHPCPWYIFGARHAEVFRVGRAQILARNIVFSLCGPTPDASLPLPPGDEPLLAFTVRHVQRGLALGLSSEQALELFIRCCLLHGESFPDTESIPALKPFTARIVNEDAAVAAMRNICTQGGYRG
ncbi:protein of unknown function [Desulfomicrobium apsheronum]|uniref:DUF4123 domain-containing protein n=1 Tax=Desulfomicrobium apsheronum TaxID=52560 RepID=A0A1I4AJ16_9BACT|nr:DUF4123 domain-containing protein [Desulfomicrobium apsheronum]SFK55931.1 protein of unknown function [Desulfomicrobium apsheronum]